MPCQSSGRRTTPLYVAALLYGLILWTFPQPSMGQQAQEGEPVDESTYVVFQFQGMEGDGPAAAALPQLVEELKETFGAYSAGSTRHVGFTPGLLFSLNLTPENLRRRVVQALDVAEETGMPVFFHLDDMHFWYDRRELFEDPQAVEWSGFPEEGERHGPMLRRYWLNWGRWVVYPSPVPCFESPKFRAHVAVRLKESVAAPITERLGKWRSEGKQFLFAGISVGNETQVPDYRGLRQTPEGQEPVGIDPTRRPPERVRMERVEMVRAGYAALHYKGYGESSLEKLASEQGKDVEELVTELLYAVAGDYAAFRAKILAEAGIPRDQIYTHFTSPFRPALARATAARRASFGTAGATALPPPVCYSVNPHSRPGFTVVRDVVDLADLTAKIADARTKTNPDRAWAAVETYATTSQPGRPQTEEEYEAYLGGMFAHAAKVVNVYGWNIPTEDRSSPFAVKNAPGVIRAVQNWVDGRDLPGTWTRSAKMGGATPPPAALQRKMATLQRRVREWRKEGKDLTPVARTMQGFESLVREGRIAEAESRLDKVLKTLATDADHPDTDPERLWESSGPKPVKLGRLLPQTEIIYHDHRFIYAMDRHGEHVTQITLENPRHWEHVAVSPDRRFIVGNMHQNPTRGSQLWLFDLRRGTEARLVQHFQSAGGGGVAWDLKGFIYFAGSRRHRESDLYKIKHDGTGLTRLTDTPRELEADVGVSEDGSLITYAKAIPAEGTCGIWVAGADGTNQRMVYPGGPVGTASAHDPEFDSDNSRVAFSVVNPDFRNWPEIPGLNTAHDIWTVNLDGTDPRRLTRPGPISIVPNWTGDWIVYVEMHEATDFRGASIIKADGTGRQRIKAGARMPKWIPRGRSEH